MKRKAILMAGTSGSGKSYASSLIVKNAKVKNIDIDVFYEYLCELFCIDLTDGKLTNTKEVVFFFSGFAFYVHLFIEMIRRNNLVLQGTSKNYIRRMFLVRLLKFFQYDVSMLYMDTEIETCLKRISSRKRVVDLDFAINSDKLLREHITKYKHYFKDRLYVIKNNNHYPTMEKIEEWFKNKGK